MELLILLVVIVFILIPILQFVLIGKTNRILERFECQEELLSRIRADQLSVKGQVRKQNQEHAETLGCDKNEEENSRKETTNLSIEADPVSSLAALSMCEVSPSLPPESAESESGQNPNQPTETSLEESVTASPEESQRPEIEPIFYEAVGEKSESALDLFFSRIGNWLCVSGEFAPQGMTREFAFVTRWLLRVGMLLIVASIAYFLKLSIDRGWVGPAQRVIGTAIFGLAMSAYGAWLIKRTNYGSVGHALSAIGFAALYLGFGMAHRYFNPPVIASPSITFAILAGVTVFGTVLAVFLNSSTISLLSLIGGYLVPILTRHNMDSPTVLYLYLALLNLGIFAVSWIRRWSVLNFLSVSAAYAISFLCLNRYLFITCHVVGTLIFLFVIHTIYLGSVLASNGRRSRSGDIIAWCGLILNALMMTGWAASLLTDHFGEHSAGWMLLVLSALYAGLARIQVIRDKENRICANLLTLISFALLWMVPLFFFENIKLAPCWCLLSAATSLLANRTDQELLRILARITAGSCFIIALATWETNYINTPGESHWLMTLGKDILQFGCVPLLFSYLGYTEKHDAWKYVMNACAIVTGFLFLTMETSTLMGQYLPGHTRGAITTVWGFYASALLTAGIMRRVKPLRVVGLCILGISVCKLLLFDTAHLDTLWRVALFAITGALLLVGASLYLKYRKSFCE